MFSTPTQANNLSFLEGHTTGSTMIETLGEPGRYSQIEKESVLRSSFNDKIQITNESQTMNRQINTSLGWVDNGPEQDSAASPTIPPPKKKKTHNATTVWQSRDPKKTSIGAENNTVKTLPKFRTTE